LQGDGKNIIADYMAMSVIDKTLLNTSNIDDVLSRFNADSERSIITCLDETEQNGTAYKLHNRITDLITWGGFPRI
jgi:hypothetical protein